MAVASIWPVKNNVSGAIKYACNPEKTTEENRVSLHAVENVVEYAADELKTERCEYVHGINCRPDNAIRLFNETRKRWGRAMDKRVCYHGYQSFKTDEVDAKTAHEIGIELAERLWGDRFEVIVATHCNTGHYHNHFVLNAVSFVDGRKYCNYKADYEQMRKVSDEICRERGISVLENSPIHTLGSKNEVWLHKAGKLSQRDMLKADMEYCLKYASNYQELESQLWGLGYSIDWVHMSVKAKNRERAIRLKNIGFTKEIIEERLYQNRCNVNFYDIWNEHLPYKSKKSPIIHLMRQLDFTVQHSKSPEKVLVSAVLYIILALFELAKQVKNFVIADVELRHEVRNIKEYISEYHFLKDEKLDTLADISNFIDKTKTEITEFEHKRNLADNKKRRAAPEKIQQYKDERKAITEHITPLRKKLKKAEQIYDKSPRLFDLIEKEYKLERKVYERSR